LGKHTDFTQESKFAGSLKTIPQYLLPHFAVTKLAYWITHSKLKPLKNFIIRWFVRHYRVDMSLAENEDPTSYQNFNHFFTRPLKPLVRPLCDEPNSVACPVDGTISQMGTIEADRIFQAKGHSFTLGPLLAYRSPWVENFHDGQFVTIYLSPKDYHRIHMPIDGTLKQMSYVPGTLFSVSPLTTRMVPDLFARNERVLCFFETAVGPMALIMVGAMIVGSIETTWQGKISPPHGKETKHWQYNSPYTHPSRSGPYHLRKGAEVGRFNMGSTIILLFKKNAVRWSNTVTPDALVQMGINIATLHNYQ